jgi:cytosine/adenosine deaminase-related metal-dependent hydrolase
MCGPAVEGGWLRVRQGKVVDLGRGPLPLASRQATVIDVPDGIIVPGLVNAHTHLEFSDMPTPLVPAGGLPAWIARLVAERRGRPQGAEGEARVAAAIRAGLTESACAGVTAIGEIATSVPVVDYATAGPRVRVFREALGLAPVTRETARRTVRIDVTRLTAAGVAAGLSPHAPYSIAAPLGRDVVAMARTSRLPLAMHIAETEAERELTSTGTGPLRELLEHLGAWSPTAPPELLPAADWITRLARAPRGIVVHGTFLDRDPAAFSRLARHRDRLGVVVCPRTTLALSGRLPPIAAFHDAGVRVAVGTDSRASNPDLSVLAECRTLVSASVASPEETIHMATHAGAWMLGFDRRAGRLAPGRPADLAVLVPLRGSADPWSDALAPDTRIAATLRAGRVIAGSLATIG